MEQLNVDDLLITIPKDKYFPKKDIEFHLKLLGCWGSTCVNVAKKIFDTYVDDMVMEVGGVGLYSILSLKYGHKAKMIETNPIFKSVFMSSIDVNNLQDSTYEHLQYFISNQVLLNGKRCTPLRELIGHGVLLLKLSPSNGMEGDVLESARPLLVEGKVSFIIFEITYVSNRRLNKKSIEVLHALINDGFRLFELDLNIELTSDFDRHLAAKLENPDENTTPRTVFAAHRTVDVDDILMTH